MKKKKLLCLVLSLALLLGSVVPSALAEEAEAPAPESTAVSSVPSDEPDVTPEPAAGPDATPEPSADTDATAEPSADPDATPEPSADPDATAEPSADPDATPESSADPDTTPEPSADPDATSVPSADPDATPVPSADPGATAEPSAEPDATPEPSAHAPGCAEDCTGEGCACGCHQPGLYEQLMACASLQELDTVLDAADEAELDALTEEQLAQLEAHIHALEPTPLPAVELQNTIGTAVPSEIVHPTVSFAQVAPLGEPVTGSAQKGGSQ